MAQGQVNVIQENTSSGSNKALEGTPLFIGLAGNGATGGVLHPIGQSTDLDAILGDGASKLKTNIEAARLNASPDFKAYAFCLIQGDGPVIDQWDEALEISLEKPNSASVEMVCLTDEFTQASDIDDFQAAAVAALNTYQKLLSIHAALPGIAVGESWTQYLAKIKALQVGKALNRVALVPQLHGNNLGVVIGRLCSSNVSIADSPIRVATGAVVGLGEPGKDKDQKPLTNDHLKELADNRFSVPQEYTDFEGTYWSDHPLLDADGGDFQVYEHLRVIDYLSRRIRKKAITKIGDRSFNPTSSSTEFHKKLFMKILKDAAKSSEIGGQPVPGLILPPNDDDVVITWKNNYEVEISFKAAVVGSPKKITARISLDLNRLN